MALHRSSLQRHHPFTWALMYASMPPRALTARTSTTRPVGLGGGGMGTHAANEAKARDRLIGSVLQGRYHVQKRIGKGGMGVVYLAEHVLLGKKVAIKTLTEQAVDTPELVDRFHREARAAAAVGSEHIVDVTDMGQLDSGGHYIVLEYLDGVDLGWQVASGGPLSVGQALHLVGQLCDALSAVHAKGIVHRDLKPENLFLIKRGGADFLKVLDFGICRVREAAGGAERRLTATGAALGTPHFMAPEQAEGGRHVDHRADIYAIGGVLYFALTGEAPFDAPTLPKLFMRICQDPPPKLRRVRPEAPEIIEEVVYRALQKDPGARFQSCEELKSELAIFVNPAAATVRSDAAFNDGDAGTAISKDNVSSKDNASSKDIASFKDNVSSQDNATLPDPRSAPSTRSAPPIGNTLATARKRWAPGLAIGSCALAGVALLWWLVVIFIAPGKTARPSDTRNPAPADSTALPGMSAPGQTAHRAVRDQGISRTTPSTTFRIEPAAVPRAHRQPNSGQARGPAASLSRNGSAADEAKVRASQSSRSRTRRAHPAADNTGASVRSSAPGPSIVSSESPPLSEASKRAETSSPPAPTKRPHTSSQPESSDRPATSSSSSEGPNRKPHDDGYVPSQRGLKDVF